MGYTIAGGKDGWSHDDKDSRKSGAGFSGRITGLGLGGVGSSNAPRLLDGGAYDQPHDLGKLQGLLGRVAGAVIGEPLDRMRRRFEVPSRASRL